MLKKQKMALVLGLFRRNSSPAFYGMIAQVCLSLSSGWGGSNSQRVQEEKLGGNEPVPGGFHLIRLPFADDIREAKFDTACRGEVVTFW